MDLDKLPDNEIKPLNAEIITTSRKRNYGLLIAVLMLINIILFVLVSKEEGDVSHKLFVGLKTLIAGSIVAGFGLGIITSLIPNKNVPYSEKYFRASLLNILIIQVLLLAGQIFFSMYN